MYHDLKQQIFKLNIKQDQRKLCSSMYAHRIHVMQFSQCSKTFINDINLENITRPYCIGFLLNVM